MGIMLTPEMGNAPDLTQVRWAADNGCFSKGADFDLARWLSWLIERPAETCVFAVAPDVVGDAKATWKRSRNVLPVIRKLGYKAALVAQDGIENMRVDWDEFDCLFIGGSTAWKLSPVAVGVGHEALSRGKWLHWGRVNSQRRLSLAKRAGADSADGTYMAFGPDINGPKMERWLTHLNSVPPLLKMLEVS